MFENLNHDNVLIYAIKSYDKLNYVKSEFQEDYKTFRYIKRLLQRYRLTRELRGSLILNHINVVYNVFGLEAGTRLLFFKTNKEDYSYLKTFLVFLNKMPDIVKGIDGNNIISSEIDIDISIADYLRKL